MDIMYNVLEKRLILYGGALLTPAKYPSYLCDDVIHVFDNVSCQDDIMVYCYFNKFLFLNSEFKCYMLIDVALGKMSYIEEGNNINYQDHCVSFISEDTEIVNLVAKSMMRRWKFHDCFYRSI